MNLKDGFFQTGGQSFAKDAGNWKSAFFVFIHPKFGHSTLKGL